MMAWRIGLIGLLLSSLNATAQSVQVVDIDGLFRRVNSTSDSLFVVNFWATWCKPCVEELPDFKSVQREMNTQPVVFLFVSLDFKSQLNSRVLPFLKKQPLKEAWLLSSGNPDAWINRISPEWSGAIPATLFWRRSERVRFHEGSLSSSELRQAVLDGLK